MIEVWGGKSILLNKVNEIESAYTSTLNRFGTMSASVDRVLLITASSGDAARLASSMQWRNYDHITMLPYQLGDAVCLTRHVDLIVFCPGEIFQHSDPKQAIAAVLRTLQSLPVVPVLLIADGYEDDFFIQCHDLGVREYLVFPVQEAMMTAKIIEQLSQKRLRHQLSVQQALLTQMGVIEAETGFLNAVYFMEQIQKMVQRAIESAGRQAFGLIVVDIELNPSATPGQLTDCKQLISSALQHAFRNQDVIGQLKVNRFGILLADTQPSGAKLVLARLNTALTQLQQQLGTSGLNTFKAYQTAWAQYRDEVHAEELLDRLTVPV
jgi:GGDEF domain-containing protein